jgi:transcriptional regulator with XRE-family HTH domain
MPVNYLRITTAKRAGAYVKECRLASALTQKELEVKCGFTAGFIGKLERGEAKRIAIPDVYEIESKLKKFKRAGFELAGKTELEISSASPIQDKSESQKLNSKSRSSGAATPNQSSGVYRKTEPIFEQLAVGKSDASNAANRPKQESIRKNSATSQQWNLSGLSDVIWRIAIVAGVLYLLGNWLFGGQGSAVDDFVPEPMSTYEKSPADSPGTSNYDEQGYDANGFDQFGYDRSGRDAFGRDRFGYDVFGYDRFGRDRFGYDRNGLDVFGYDTFGRDAFGRDRSGCNTKTRLNQFGNPC